MSQNTLTTYRGNCHCAAFVFEVQLPEIKSYSDCNCSICVKKGYAWVFPSDQNPLRVVKGSIDELKTYTFNNNVFEHKFCGHCGIGVLASSRILPPGQNLGINIRALQNVDIHALEKTTLNGQQFPPPYEPKPYSGPEPEADIEDGVMHHGSCHCGAITIALKSKPFEKLSETVDEDRIVECNCSFCTRSAAVWIYPTPEQVSIQGREHANYYIFGTRLLRKVFCSVCGVWIANELNPESSKDISALPDVLQEWARRFAKMAPLTLRSLDGYGPMQLKSRKYDGWNLAKPTYRNP